MSFAGNIATTFAVLSVASCNIVWNRLWKLDPEQSDALVILREQLSRCGPENLRAAPCPPCTESAEFFEKACCFTGGAAVVLSFWIAERVRTCLSPRPEPGVADEMVSYERVLNAPRWSPSGSQVARRIC